MLNGKHISINFNDFLYENNNNIFYHGTPDKNLIGKKGIHVGTKLAATQALESRIGVPATGTWDGTRTYGETLLAGHNRLLELEKERGYYLITGYNTGNDLPIENYYPADRLNKAKYSDGTNITLNSKPIIFKVKIIGKMSNTPYTPYSDIKANSLIIRQLKLNNAKCGYYYINDGEDEGSLSAVVPNSTFLILL